MATAPVVPEAPKIPEETHVISKVKSWNGPIKNIRTLYRHQVEVKINRENLLSLTKFLLSNGWPYITSASGVDWPTTQELEMVYFFSNHENQKIVIVKTRCPYSDPTIPSLCRMTMSTNFHEREACDLFGIRFPGHMDQIDPSGQLPKLLLPDDWPQFETDPWFPFRKEYVQIALPFEKVVDTRGFQGKRWEQYYRAIDRSGWLDEYYKESSSPIDKTLRVNVAPE